MFQLFNTYPYNTKKYKRYEKHFRKFRKQKPYNIKKVKKYLRLLNGMSTSWSAIIFRTRSVNYEILKERTRPLSDIAYKAWLENEIKAGRVETPQVNWRKLTI